jgi:putative flippase GtrA
VTEPAAAPQRGVLARFLLSGAVNTLLTYVLYLLLLAPLAHRVAYTIAFASGIALAYALNRGFVFRSHAGWRSALALPLIYLLQYALGMAIIEVWVAVAGLSAALAPLAAIAITVPLVYWLSRAAFAPR